MSAIPTPEPADYFVDQSGSIRVNETGSAVVKAFRDAEQAYDELQLAWAGACLASLFIQHPWLQSLKITLTATAEYNDEGGSYRSVSSTVTDVQGLPEAAVPEELLSDGHFDSEQAAAVIKDDIDEVDLDLYTSIRPEYDDFSELELNLNRSILSATKDGTPLSGAAVYRSCLASSTDRSAST